MKRVLIALTLTLCLSETARAELFFEPYFGLTFGTLKSTSAITGNVGESENSNGAIGARLAWHLDMAYFGVDAMSTLGAQTKSNTTGNRTDWQETTAWLLGGARLEKVRLFGGYGVMNDAESKSSISTKLKGESYKIGIGYTDLPITINLEYWMTNYKKMQLGSGSETDIPNSLINKVTNDLLFVSVSIPMML